MSSRTAPPHEPSAPSRAPREPSGGPSGTLSELGVGAKAVVSRLGNERPVALRLMELGLLPGTPVEVTRVAPLGDPLELKLRGYRLSIRRYEARLVQVTIVEPAIVERA